ncbi:hypothetical protein KBY88_06035 [Cyanobium sp. Morenito 9A2]|nr:hypothetical protein [Cyanobium sp. Morenito 9A2]MCP9849370.1 hypothetical protein [Cyanobium sp. Morenito 9A2]
MTPHLRQAVLVSALLVTAAAAQAQTLLPDRYAKSCPLLVPVDAPYLQPKRLKPDEVALKNAAGCLSPADAVYGRDGCPTKLCPNPKGLSL